MIPPEQILDFCHATKDEREPRDRPHGRFYLRDGDEKKPVEGKPVLPKGFERYLSMGHIKGAVKSVSVDTKKVVNAKEGQEQTTCRIVINVGQADGVLPRMRFYVSPPNSHWSDYDATIIEVKEKDAVATLTFHEYPHTKRKPPEVGWKATTEWEFLTRLKK